jgi:PTH2 family peptidyl-tRNA hydrolase
MSAPHMPNEPSPDEQARLAEAAERLALDEFFQSQEPSGGASRTHKQALVLRKDIQMNAGKLIAQGAHASWSAVLSRATKTPEGWLIPDDDDVGPWLSGRFAKVGLRVESENDLIAIFNRARALGLPCSIIRDAGLTQFKGAPTLTAVAVGPAEASRVDAVTGHLRLL